MTAFSSDSIPLLYYVYPEDSAMAEYDFAQTPQMMDYFSDTFGEYPFQMYGMAEARIFYGWGAMEHQTMTTYGDNLITGNRNFENVVAHELSHMWWGDALTPLTFADIWLNEGFATYSEALCMDHFYNNLAENMAQNAEYYFWEDQNQLRYPIYNPPSDFLFGSAVYNKGAWVQYMLEYVMGDSAFFTGWRNYFDAYRYGNVITSEYQAEMEAEYGDELDWFFQEWVYQAGFPIYDYHWEVIPSGQTYDVTFELWQIQTNAPIFSMPIALSFTFATGDTVVAIWNDQPNQIFQFEFASEPLNLAFDFDNRILKWDATLGVKSLTIAQPGSFQLEPNYPNPFNSQTRLGFSIATPGEYSLKIFNSQGELVEELLRSYLNAGEYSYIWDGDGLATGIYWEILTNGPISKANKIIMLK
jgi:aminopeptidase N